VLASFLLLAAVLAGLKAAGVAVGWGLQFQQPLFVAAMALLLTLFAGNLWGFFEVPLPGFAGDLAAAVDRRHGLAADFLTGALATLLATPCTAPFLASAVGFALAGGTAEIFLIFLALGLGLAAPYLLVAAWPRLATRLPRPGRWMLVLKRLLGLSFIATATWLLYVLASQVGAVAGLATAVALLVLILLLGVARLPIGRRLPKPLWRAGLLAAAATALIVPTMPAETAAPVAAPAGAWSSFSEPKLAALVAQGKVVLVDVTADWCINCQVNEALILRRGWTADSLTGGSLVGMRADWTRPDPAIARYLAGFGRYGIPFNAVYGPRAPQGIALPSLLTEQAVRDAVQQAGGS
jgi:suppressor for copper-sensitivity B